MDTMSTNPLNKVISAIITIYIIISYYMYILIIPTKPNPS